MKEQERLTSRQEVQQRFNEFVKSLPEYANGAQEPSVAALKADYSSLSTKEQEQVHRDLQDLLSPVLEHITGQKVTNRIPNRNPLADVYDNRISMAQRGQGLGGMSTKAKHPIKSQFADGAPSRRTQAMNVAKELATLLQKNPELLHQYTKQIKNKNSLKNAPRPGSSAPRPRPM